MTPIAQGQCASRQTAPGALFCDRDILDVLAKRNVTMSCAGAPRAASQCSGMCRHLHVITAVGDVDDRRRAIFNDFSWRFSQTFVTESVSHIQCFKEITVLLLCTACLLGRRATFVCIFFAFFVVGFSGHVVDPRACG